VRNFLPAAPPAHAPLFETLTGRERQLVELLAEGRDNAQIAATLGLSTKTVRNHLTRVFAKLEVDNRSRTIVLARDSGFGKLQH
jgi:DNA-binding NarL/FixJ family response regulator